MVINTHNAPRSAQCVFVADANQRGFTCKGPGVHELLPIGDQNGLGFFISTLTQDARRGRPGTAGLGAEAGWCG